MKLTGSHLFEADQATVWELLMNPEAIAKALPGVKELIPIEGHDLTWQISAKVGLPFLSGNYMGTIQMREVEVPNQYRLTVSGGGQHSEVNGTTLISLTQQSDPNQTRVSWVAEATVSGELASISERFIAVGANALSQQFFHELAKQL